MLLAPLRWIAAGVRGVALFTFYALLASVAFVFIWFVLTWAGAI